MKKVQSQQVLTLLVYTVSSEYCLFSQRLERKQLNMVYKCDKPCFILLRSNLCENKQHSELQK